MTCKDCIHYNVCNDYDMKTVGEALCCHNFKDKSYFVELPHCKVGDKVYSVVECETSFVDEGYIESFAIERGSIDIYTRYECGLTYWYCEEDIGKRFFFTREEAEKALEAIIDASKSWGYVTEDEKAKFF